MTYEISDLPETSQTDAHGPIPDECLPIDYPHFNTKRQEKALTCGNVAELLSLFWGFFMRKAVSVMFGGCMFFIGRLLIGSLCHVALVELGTRFLLPDTRKDMTKLVFAATTTTDTSCRFVTLHRSRAVQLGSVRHTWERYTHYRPAFHC